jgi:hypothetical protein
MTIERSELPWAADEKAIATKYLNEKCGPLHLAWALDHYWGLVTQQVILPGSLAIYEELLKHNLTEDNPRMWGDADGSIFYIPCADKKVFVHKTQGSHYLYIIQGTDESYGRFDIRRIYPDLQEDDYVYQQAMKDRYNIDNLLSCAHDLMSFNDDHKRWASERPSLEAYRRIDFKIPYTLEHMKELCHYGDPRDHGYILGYDFNTAKIVHPMVEGSTHVFAELETIATCYLGSMACDLNIEVPELSGYGY